MNEVHECMYATDAGIDYAWCSVRILGVKYEEHTTRVIYECFLNCALKKTATGPKYNNLNHAEGS
jgi:hypothetical protein